MSSGGKEYSARTKRTTGTLHQDSIQVLVQGDTVIQVVGGEVACLHRTTGERRWLFKAAQGVVHQATIDKAGNVYLMLVDDRDEGFKGQFVHFPGRSLTASLPTVVSPSGISI